MHGLQRTGKVGWLMAKHLGDRAAGCSRDMEAAPCGSRALVQITHQASGAVCAGVDWVHGPHKPP